MAELKVEKPSAPPKRTREELMALYNKNPNVNPQTVAPASATPKGSPAVEPKESFLDVVGQRMGTPTPMPLREGDMGMSAAGPIDQSRSPITGRPNPKITVNEITGANFSAGLSPVGNALKNSPVVDSPRVSTPIGNITGLDNSVSTNPYRVSAAGGDEITGANFSAGLSPVGNALKNSPVVDSPRVSTPIGNITGLDNSVSTNSSPKLGEAPAVDMDRAAALFVKTHGSAFEPKSSVDKKKMAAITNLMRQEGSEALTPNQFALKIYRTTKK
jgi:hypothetical protein